MGALALTPHLKSTAIHKRAHAGVGLEEEKHLGRFHTEHGSFILGVVTACGPRRNLGFYIDVTLSRRPSPFCSFPIFLHVSHETLCLMLQLRLWAWRKH